MKRIAKPLIALARDGLAAGRVTRRANALVLLLNGDELSTSGRGSLVRRRCTIRGWYELFEQSGVEGREPLRRGQQFEQDDAPTMRSTKAWVGATLRARRVTSAWIAKEFGLVYEKAARG